MRRKTMGRIIKAVIRLGIVPKGWLTILSGFGGVLVGGGSLIGSMTGLYEPVVDDTAAVTLLTGGLAAVGLGRRGQK